MQVDLSTIEKMVGGEFSSDPRCSRFPLPEIPDGTPQGVSYTHSGFVVTAEIAKDWILHRSIRRDVMPDDLKHNDVTPNRKYLIHYAKTWSRNLQKPGHWNKGIHQGLAFTPDGFILDGQHRLAGCALSGVPLIIPVAVNVPWSAFKDIDQNRHRSAHQMIDIPYAPEAASVARYLLPVLRGTSAVEFTFKGREYNEEVIEICLGWPYFAEDQSWMKEIKEAAREGIPVGPLGSVCIGAMAGGADPDDVQQFLSGLQPFSNVKYITIGTDGADPRQLLAKHFRMLSRNKGDKARYYDTSEQRANVGSIRNALDVWLRRHDEKPRKIKTMSRWGSDKDLPPLWNEPGIREFHDKHVN